MERPLRTAESGGVDAPSELFFAQLKAQRTQRVLEVVDASLEKQRELREERKVREEERAQEAERRKQRLLNRLGAIESEESRAATRTIARLAGDAQDAADDVVNAQERRRRLLAQVRRVDAQA